MNIEELNSIISKGENSRIEFKESGEMVSVGFYQTVVSFLNHEGGVILLGVDDNGLVRGQAGLKKGSGLKVPESTKSTSYNLMIFKRGQAGLRKGSSYRLSSLEDLK